MSLLDEVAEGEGITRGITAGETLICHVEERVVAALLDNIANGHPLLLSGIYAGGVVRAGVQEDNTAFRQRLNVCDHAIEVEANSVLVVIPVLVHLKACILKYGGVIGPAGRRDVYRLGTGIESLDESTSNAQRPCAGQGLCDGDAVFFDGRRVCAVGQIDSGLVEGGNAGDAGVFLVEVCVNNLLFRGFDRGEDVRFAGIVAVGSDA